MFSRPEDLAKLLLNLPTEGLARDDSTHESYRWPT
jgi:hypothetical protein